MRRENAERRVKARTGREGKIPAAAATHGRPGKSEVKKKDGLLAPIEGKRETDGWIGVANGRGKERGGRCIERQQ